MNITTNSAGGIIINKRGQILVVNQKHKSWSLPKGHCESKESDLETAKREIYEESGVRKLKFIKDLGSYERYKMGLDGNEDTSELKKIHFFLFSTNQEKLSPKDPENPEARWVEKEQVTSLLTHKKDKEFFLKFLREN